MRRGVSLITDSDEEKYHGNGYLRSLIAPRLVRRFVTVLACICVLVVLLIYVVRLRGELSSSGIDHHRKSHANVVHSELTVLQPRSLLNESRYFWIRNNSFVIKMKASQDERETLVFAGEIHYFRIQSLDWRDRLRKLKACGFNAGDVFVGC
jgi:hypothetical protein